LSGPRRAGRTHEVVGAIAVVRDGELQQIASEITKVHFRDAHDGLLDWYVATGEWQGRAGGYAIQGAGAVLVAGIEGDYLNVVGLPLQRLIDLVPELLPTPHLEGSDPFKCAGRKPAPGSAET
jgi:septum formation protein